MHSKLVGRIKNDQQGFASAEKQPEVAIQNVKILVVSDEIDGEARRGPIHWIEHSRPFFSRVSRWRWVEKVTVHGQGEDYGGHSLQAVGGESRT